MTRMTGPDCAVMCNLINIHTYIQPSGQDFVPSTVCVRVLPSPYSGRQTCGRTSRGHTGGRSYRISPPSFCSACLNFSSRGGFSPSFPSSTVKSHFLYPRIYSSPLVGHDFYYYIYIEPIYFVSENLRSCDCTEVRTHVPTSEGFEHTN